jgi:hypothetical protein
MNADLLDRVHVRIGGVGLDISTFGESGSVEIRWRRDYGDAGLSDERQASGASLTEALLAILEYEDWADAHDEAEAGQ